jgi:hypothetical protein
MTQNTNQQHPLSVPKTNTSAEIEQAFAGDLLERMELGNRLTGYLDRLRAGAVLAIDAQWGDGKTWFGRNWAKQLKDQNHKVISIDAFKQDYIEDPFILIAAEIAHALDDGQQNIQDLQEKATGVMKAILPIGTKLFLKFISRQLGSGDISEDVKIAIETVNEGAEDITTKWIEDKFANHDKEKASFQHFRTALAALAQAQDKPLVIIIDELDRCRPDFAVKLIERIKHFFDVPNVVFILLINREQLETAIKGVYGSGTDSATYLGKFVNFFFRLPKQQQKENISRRYIEETLSRYNFYNTSGYSQFRDHLTVLAVSFSLSLRDIQKAVALYALAHPISDWHYGFLEYVIVLKITKPLLLQRLIKGEIEAHKEAKEFLSPLSDDLNVWYLKFLTEWHIAHASDFVDIGTNFGNFINGSQIYHIDRKKIFANVAKKIDLTME